MNNVQNVFVDKLKILNLSFGQNGPFIEILDSQKCNLSSTSSISSNLSNSKLLVIANCKNLNISSFHVQNVSTKQILEVISNNSLNIFTDFSISNCSSQDMFISIGDSSNPKTNSKLNFKNFVFAENSINYLIVIRNIEAEIFFENIQASGIKSVLGKSSFDFDNIKGYLNLTNSKFEKNIINGFIVAISNIQVVNLIDVVFQNNKAVTSIDSVGTSLLIEDVKESTISKLSVQNCISNSSTTGIKILTTKNYESYHSQSSKNAKFALSDSKFINNIVYVSNTSIYIGVSIFLDFKGIGIISKTQIEKNSHIYSNETLTKQEGSPCVYSYSEENTLDIVDSNFMNNAASSYSNCIYFVGILMRINNTVLHGNRNLNNDITGLLTLGGAIYLAGDYNHLKNVTITNNSASIAGGLYLMMKLPYRFQYFYIKESRIDENLAQSAGGFMMQTNNFVCLMVLEINDTTFHNNSATLNGGVFWTIGIGEKGAKWEFRNTSFKYNVAPKGGALYVGIVFPYHFYIYNSIFLGNRATSPDDGGGAILAGYNFTLWTRNCEFINNTALSKGGFADIHEGNIRDQNSKFINNTATTYGGFISARFSKSLFENSTIENSYAEIQGGLLFLIQSAEIEFIGVKVKNISSARGAICSVTQECFLKMSKSEFTDVVAESGSFLYSVNSLFQINMSDITLTNFTDKQGIFYVELSKIVLSGFTIINSKGNLYFTKRSTINMKDTNIQNHDCSFSPLSYCMNFNQKDTFILENFKMENSVFKGIDFIRIRNKANFQFKNISLVSINIDQSASQRGFIFVEGDSKISIDGFVLKQYHKLLLEVRNSEITIINSDFDGTGDNFSNFPLLKAVLCKKVYIKNSKFKSLKGIDGGAIHILGDQKMKNSNGTVASGIVSCEFMSNSAKSRGGAVYIINEEILIQDSKFNGNEAVFGAGVYFDQDVNADLRNCDFSNNKATSHGGGYYWSMKPVKNVKNLKFTENTPNDIGALPTKLLIKDAPNDISSGVNFAQDELLQKKNISVWILDPYNQECSYINSGFLFIDFYEVPKDSEFANVKWGIIGNNIKSIQGGKVLFEKLTFLGKPKAQVSLRFWADPIAYFNSYVFLTNSTSINRTKQINQTGSYIISLNISFRDCVSGEIITDNKCQKCERNYFSFYPNDPICYPCPDNCDCLGGREVSVRFGFWRKNSNSTKILKCNIFRQGCKGGTSDQLCFPGYYGAICASCIYNATTKYFRTSSKTCEPCAGSNKIMASFMFLMLSSVLTVQVLISVISVRRIVGHKILSVYSNMFISHFQLASLLTYIQVDWDNIVYNSADATNVLGDFDLLGSIECDLAKIALDLNSSVYGVKLFLSVYYFVGAFIIAYIILLILHVFKKVHFGQFYLPVYLALLKATFQPVLKLFAKTLDCITIDSNSYLKGSTDVKCWDNHHILLIMGICLPILMILYFIPLIVFFIYLYKNSKNIHLKNFRQKVWIFIQGYNDNYFMWEYIMFGQKLIITLVVVLLNKQNTASCMIVLLIIFIYLIANLSLKPYALDELNDLSVYQNIALYTTFIGGLFLTEKKNLGSSMVIIVFIAIMHVVFVLLWAKQTLSLVKEKFLTITSALKRKFSRTIEKNSKSIQSSKSPNSMKSPKSIKSNSQKYSSSKSNVIGNKTTKNLTKNGNNVDEMKLTIKMKNKEDPKKI